MNYWLIKSEPFKYSWQQLEKDGSAIWDGVRNYKARNNMCMMKKNDLLLFYHSNEGLEIVGIAKVKREAFDEFGDKNKIWSAVEIEPVISLNQPLKLNQIKSDSLLVNMQMLKLNRLSVCEVKEEEFERILFLSQTKFR